MDIHPPAGPVHSIKDFFIHLSMIVIGILVALSLEQLLESWHHANLVREAKANITSEIRDNKSEIEKTLKTYNDTEANLRKVLEVAKQVRAHHPPRDVTLTLSLRISQLGASSRGSAEATGALGYMEYSEVKKLVGVYELQQQYLRLQDRALDTLALTLAAVKRGDPSLLSERELDGMTENANGSLANMYIIGNIGQQLSKAYAEALAGER